MDGSMDGLMGGWLQAHRKVWVREGASFEKVDFFACLSHVCGMFPGKILRHYDIIIFHFQFVTNKTCPKLRTILDTLGPSGEEGAFIPLACANAWSGWDLHGNLLA